MLNKTPQGLGKIEFYRISCGECLCGNVKVKQMYDWRIIFGFYTFVTLFASILSVFGVN